MAVTAAKPVMNFAPTLTTPVLALCWLTTLAWAVPAAALSSQQSLVSAVQELTRAPATTRAAFVEAAVVEMAAAHHRAAARPAGRPVKAGKGNPHDRKLAGWNKGTQAYIGRLQRAAAAARDGAPVRLLVDRGRILRVVVGGQPARQFIIAAPQPNGRPALERAILRRLCAVDGCQPKTLTSLKGEPPLTTVRITAPNAPPIAGTGTPAEPLTSYRPSTPPKPVAPPAPRLVSSLSGSDGLACVEDEVRHHVLYDHACQALLTDVRALVTALHAAARRGVSIDWRMPARPRPKGESHELAINGQGGTVSVPMPALGEAPELLLEILPWAQGRLFGRFQPLALRPPSRLVYGAAVAQR